MTPETPLQRRALDWLVLIDASETYRELADGYQRFQRELVGRGYAGGALDHAPNLAAEELWRDLFWVWRELPARFGNIPARADLVPSSSAKRRTSRARTASTAGPQRPSCTISKACSRR